MPATSPATRGARLAPELARLTAPARVSTRPPDRAAYARDLWPRTLIAIGAGDTAPYPPDVVVWPETVDEVQAVVRLAGERGVPIVPFGAGSGVCGGALPLQGGIVVDLKRMRRVLDVDGDALTAAFECGIVGEHLEHELARRGFTLGHFPSSIMCSTLGGWLAARSGGQCSTRYGKIEDLVRSIEFVTGTGERVETDVAAATTGPDLTQLLVGSEGTLGILTRAELRIRRAPEVRHLRGFAFPRLGAGCEAMRRVMQRGLRPFVLRLYDELDSFVARRALAREAAPEAAHAHASDDGHRTALDDWLDTLGGARARDDLRRWATRQALARTGIANRLVDAILPRVAGGCLLIAGVEGDRALADAEWRAVAEELARAGGEDLGPRPGERWLRNRYAISFGMSKVFDAGAFVDTMEVATTWERLLDLYRAVRAAVAPHAFIMAHFSHAYAEGCSIYFTFAAADPGGREARAAAERRYDTIWRAALSAATGVGATISHHHGVGVLKAAFMPEEHGEGMRVLGALKSVLDPGGVLNPGKLGIVAAPPVAAAAAAVGGDAHADLVAAVGAGQVARDGDRFRVRPRAASEVAATLGVAAARALRVSVADEAAVHLDPERMSAILDVDESSLLVHAQAGIRVGALEDALAARGLTLGPLPVATRARRLGAVLAAPRPSEATPRGRLLDACVALDAVVADGASPTLVTTRLAPRKATGPELAHVFLGARGATGVIVGAWLRASRVGPARATSGWSFAATDGAALGVARTLLARDARPAQLALVDDQLYARFDGTDELVAAEAALLRALAEAAGAAPLADATVAAWFAAPPALPPVETFVPTRALAAAWAARPPGAWLWTLGVDGGVLVSDGLVAEPRALAHLHTDLARRLDPHGVLRA